MLRSVRHLDISLNISLNAEVVYGLQQRLCTVPMRLMWSCGTILVWGLNVGSVVNLLSGIGSLLLNSIDRVR